MKALFVVAFVYGFLYQALEDIEHELLYDMRKRNRGGDDSAEAGVC